LSSIPNSDMHRTRWPIPWLSFATFSTLVAASSCASSDPARQSYLIELRDTGSIGSPVLKAAHLQHLFSAIHPFADGNGRVSRLLASLPLVAAGFPPIIVADERKAEYYRALGQVRAYGVSTLLTDCYKGGHYSRSGTAGAGSGSAGRSCRSGCPSSGVATQQSGRRRTYLSPVIPVARQLNCSRPGRHPRGAHR
jgi:hypothetical protein